MPDVDVAVTLSPILSPTVRVETLHSAKVVAIITDGDPLGAEQIGTPTMFTDRPLISHGSHAEIGAALDEAFASEGQMREVSIQIASSVGALPLVRQGLGIVARPFRPAVATPVSLSINEARP